MPNHHLRRVQGRTNLRSPTTPSTPRATTTTPSLRRIPKDSNLRSSYTLVPAPLHIHKVTSTSTFAVRAAAANARVLREAKTKEIEDAMIRAKTRAAILETAEETGVEWWVPDICF